MDKVVINILQGSAFTRTELGGLTINILLLQISVVSEIMTVHSRQKLLQ